MPARRDVMQRTFSSLRTRNFRLFFIGQLVSNSGNWLTTVAIGLLILHRSGSGAAVGLLAVCQFGPILVLSAGAGLVADRTNKRHLLYVTQSLEMIESFVLAALAFVHNAPLPAFYVTALAGGCMLAFDNPARRSFVNEMVQPGDVSNAVTLYSAMVNLSRIVGPALGGLLIVTLGYGWCFTVDGISYVVVIVALIMMHADELRRAVVTPRGKGQIRAGIRYVANTPTLLITFTMLLIIGIASYNFTVVFPLFIERGLHGSDAQYTVFYAIFGAGAVVGTMFVARRVNVGVGSVIIGAGTFGLSLSALAFVPNIVVADVVVAVVGATSVSFMTAATAIAQIKAGPQMMGRVVALQTVVMIGTTPIGGPISGIVSDAFGGRTPVLVGGIAALGAAGLGLVATRRQRAKASPAGAGTSPDSADPAQTTDAAALTEVDD